MADPEAFGVNEIIGPPPARMATEAA